MFVTEIIPLYQGLSFTKLKSELVRIEENIGRILAVSTFVKGDYKQTWVTVSYGDNPHRKLRVEKQKVVGGQPPSEPVVIGGYTAFCMGTCVLMNELELIALYEKDA